LVRLWGLATGGSKGQAELARLIDWEGRAVRFTLPSFPAEVPNEVRHSMWQDNADQGESRPRQPGYFCCTFESLPSSNTLLALAWGFLQVNLNNELRAATPGAMDWSRKRCRPVVQVRPSSLLGALWLQLALAVDRGPHGKVGRCEFCGRRLLLAPGTSRVDRITCSDSCRVRLHKRRRQIAQQMHADGKTPREIARETGVAIDSVKGWLKRDKGKGK